MERDSPRDAIHPGLQVLARCFKTGLGFSARPNGLKNPGNHLFHPGPKKEREQAHRLCFRTSVNFLLEICVLRRAEIEHVTPTIFQPGGRNKISARAETHPVIRLSVHV